MAFRYASTTLGNSIIGSKLTSISGAALTIRLICCSEVTSTRRKPLNSPPSEKLSLSFFGYVPDSSGTILLSFSMTSSNLSGSISQFRIYFKSRSLH